MQIREEADSRSVEEGKEGESSTLKGKRVVIMVTREVEAELLKTSFLISLTLPIRLPSF